MTYSVVVDDTEQSGLEAHAMAAAERRAEDERDGPKTLAELTEYVSAARDPGGGSYCATKTWYGSGLSDAFERLAAHLSPAERRAAEQNMRAVLPPCRNCGCQQTKLKEAWLDRLEGQPINRSEEAGEWMFERSVREDFAR
jgi:hypothetical protein